MIIYNKNGTVLLDIPVDDTSFRYRAIMASNSVTLYYSLTEHVEIPKGSYLEFAGQRYTLWRPENFKKNGSKDFSYTVEFGGNIEYLKLCKLKLTSAIPYRLKFSLTAKPAMFMQLLVDCLNIHDSGWAVGSCIDAPEKTLQFSHEYCFDALNKYAEEFTTEWDYVNKTISLCKVEKFKDAPLPLSYGKGNGFKKGVGRQNEGSKTPVTYLYVQGGERNIALSTYGSKTLLLPKSQQLVYQGRTYTTDADGMAIYRADKALVEYNEDSYDASDIYPSRVGSVTSVEVVDADNNAYDFVDSSIPEALDFSQFRIAGETISVIFQTGALTGKEFNLIQTDSSVPGYVHAERRFRLVPQEYDGVMMPGGVFVPSAGDKYAVFNISLPDAYVCNNADKTGASWDMFREAARYMYENEEDQFTFTGELDSLYSKSNWLVIGGKIVPGGYIQFSDTHFYPEGTLIRITGVKDYINNPYSPSIELSNSVSAGSVGGDLGKIPAGEVVVNENFEKSLNYTKRRWRDAMENLSLLEKAMKNFQPGINPVWIKTMSILVGEESLQFRFVDDTTTPASVNDSFTWNNETKIFSSLTGVIQHMTIGVKSLSSSHAASEYLFWDIAPYVSPALIDPDPLYVYLKCDKVAMTGTVLLSKTPYDPDPADGNYYFLAAALSSESEGERSFVTTYGFTEITPGRITLDKIVSPDGFQFWDMLSRAFRIGDASSYLKYENGTLEAQRLLIKSPGGSEAYAEIYVGEYNPARKYHPGEYFDYEDGNQYICTLTPPTVGVLPTNTAYFRVKVRKSDSDWPSHVFKESLEQPATPTGTSPIPDGWIDGPTGLGTWWMSVTTVNGATGLAGSWSVPVQVTGANGTKTPFRFAKNTSLDVYPTIDVANINPGEAWLVDPPAIVDGEYLWMTKAEIRTMAQDSEGNVFDDIFSDEFWGAAALERVDQLVANWSVPVRISGEKGSDGKDGKDYEYIFSRTGTAVAPARPSTSQDDDFVPLGWTDDPKGTDAANVYEWVCKRIKVNGVWSEFSSPALWSKWSRDGEDGDPGADAIEASLSNAQHNIPTDFNGNNGNFTGAACTMYIYKGVVDDSANWEVSIVKSAGVTGSLSGKTYSVTGLSTDNGYVDFTASRTGYASITKRMTLTKSKTGEPGVTPTAYWLVTPPSVARSSAGVYTPASFTVYSYKSVSATPELHSGQFVISETEDGSTYVVKYTSSANESGKSYTPSSANVKSFKVTLRKSVTDSTVLDDQVIPVVMQGANGADGISYMLSANANVVTKTVALSTVTYTPSTLTFNPRKRVGSAVPVAPADCSLKIQGWNGTGWVDISNIASATELTYSVPVSSTYTQYRAQLYLSAVMVQELVINVVEDAKSGKDALAFAFGGFSSYEEYVLSAISKESLFAGGFIRTVLIEVEALFAKALQISTIADLVGTQFDANLVTVTQQKGMTFPALINGTDTNLNITPQSLPELATFLSASSLTGTNYLTAFTNEVWSSSGGPQYGEKTKISPSYQTIPAGVNSLKWNSIAMTAIFTVPSGGSGDPDRKGGLWISLYAHFYNGSTYLGRQFMGTVGGMGATRTYNLSGSISAGQCSVPTNANRVYLYAQFACDVRYTTQTAPDCNLNFTALPSLAYFASSTGVYKTQVAPDGVAVARDASNYIHIKAGNNKMLLSFMGDIDSNSIAQKLLTMSIAASGLIVNSGGYMRIAGLATGLYVTKVSTGVWKITHNIYSNWGLGPSSYTVHPTVANAGYNIPAYIYQSASDTVNYNWTEIRAMNHNGVLVDTEFYLTIMRI